MVPVPSAGLPRNNDGPAGAPLPSLYDIHKESAHDHPVRLVPAHHHTRNDSLPSPGIDRPWLSPYPLQEMYGCFSHNHNLYMLHGVPSCSIYHIGIIHFYHLQFIALEFSIFFDSNIPKAASSALSYRQVNPSYKSMPGAYLILLPFTHVYQHTCKPAVSPLPHPSFTTVLLLYISKNSWCSMNPAHVMAVLCFLVAVAFVVSDFNGMFYLQSSRLTFQVH